MGYVMGRPTRGYREGKMKKSGFTLVEVMFAATIGLLVMGMIMILYVGANQNMILGMTLAEINADARLAMDRIVRDIRWGSEIETSRTVGTTTYFTGNDEIIIKVPSIDAGGTIIASTFDYVIYALDASDATNLRKIIDPDGSSSRSSSNQVVASNINSFALSSGGVALSSVGSLSTVSAVKISIFVNKEPLLNRAVSETLTSSAELRNN